MKLRVLVKLYLSMEIGRKHIREEKSAYEESNSKKHKI